MALSLCAIIAVVVFLPCVQSLSCGSGYNIHYCLPDDHQTAYCCGYDDECCYRTNVAELWWFWLLLIGGLIFLISLCSFCCYRRRYPRTGYVVVPGQTRTGAAVTVVQSNQTHTTQAPHPVGYPPNYQPGYQPGYQQAPGYQQYGGPKVASAPPPYYGQPPTAPQQPYVP